MSTSLVKVANDVVRVLFANALNIKQQELARLSLDLAQLKVLIFVATAYPDTHLGLEKCYVAPGVPRSKKKATCPKCLRSKKNATWLSGS